jgi:crotonobetainyl-CoA:carnitine CoA-transferase CaiB-like acyl-CoA transferase
MAAWSDKLAAAGVPAGPINPVPAVFADPQVKHREMLIELPHPVAGKVPQIASPIRYAEAPIEYRRAPPLVGEHTREVLEELGIPEVAD